MNLNVTPQQLRRAADIKERIDALQAELSALVGSPAPIIKGGISPAGRARIAAAQRVRWAKVRGNGGPGQAADKPKRRMSPAQKARLSAVARARWRKAKAAGKNAL